MRKYTKIDENNVAVIETIENRTILNKNTLILRKNQLTEKYNEEIDIIDEALNKFTK